MAFSSLIFLCIFLPVVFLLHSVIPVLPIRNGLLIVASLVFYVFGEPVYILLMLGSVLMNYCLARLMTGKKKKAVLIAAVFLNVGTLAVFKYLNFFVESLNDLFSLHLPVPGIALPIGISFFTFQAMSYVIDVYREQVSAEKNPMKVLLYISFFPQLIAGPIVKYRDIREEIDHRSVTITEAAPGFRRFIYGLAKKVLIANTMAVAVDAIFAEDISLIGLPAAWVAAIAYMLQIYFDFSGYSDMAIGMGRMFGFHFKENFEFPYASVNIKEFWRRWHISLSSWFKDYVYIPLGGNRKGKIRTGLNKLIVFFLCGLWHGANWTFVLWGLYHGFFSFLEECIAGIRKLPRILGHIYTLIIVCIGFVIFRAENIGQAFQMIGKMFSFSSFDKVSTVILMQQLTPFFLVMLVAGILLSIYGERPVKAIRSGAMKEEQTKKEAVVQTIFYFLGILLLMWSILRLAGGSYNPFIYFRF